MIGNVVARRYAQALVDVVQAQREDLDAVKETLQRVSQVISGNADLSVMLYNPSVNLEFKREVLDILIEKWQLVPVLVNFLHLLLDKDRLKYLPEITRAYEELANAARNRMKITVRSAYPLSTELREELRRRFSNYTGKEVLMNVEVDPDLLGGIVAQIGSVILDGSVRNQLRQLSAEMMRG